MLTSSSNMELEGSPFKKARDGQLDGVAQLRDLKWFLDSLQEAKRCREERSKIYLGFRPKPNGSSSTPFSDRLRNLQLKGPRDPNIVSNGRRRFKSASILAVSMVVIGNTSAVGAVRAMAPEAAEPGSLQAEDFEKSPNFWFGVITCIGALFTIIGVLMSVNWGRHHSVTGTSAASARAVAI